jgi:hypothetical protein
VLGPLLALLQVRNHPGWQTQYCSLASAIVWDPVTREFPQGAEGGHGAPSAEAAHAPVAESGHGASPYGDTGFNLAHSIETSLHSELGTEWLFIILSLVAAGIGMGLGWLFYLKNPRLPDIWANRLRHSTLPATTNTGLTILRLNDHTSNNGFGSRCLFVRFEDC